MTVRDVFKREHRFAFGDFLGFPQCPGCKKQRAAPLHVSPQFGIELAGPEFGEMLASYHDDDFVSTEDLITGIL